MIRPEDVERVQPGQGYEALLRQFNKAQLAWKDAKAVARAAALSNSEISAENTRIAAEERQRMGYATDADMWRERGQYAPFVSPFFDVWPPGQRADNISDVRRLLSNLAREQTALVTRLAKRVGKVADLEKRRILRGQ